jgi:pyrroloquinoline-quinone synthase
MPSFERFAEDLNGRITANKMLNHPFYAEWNKGTLSREALREYAKQYDAFVQAFPTLISATHANTPRLDVRQELLENLIEEERGDGNHPGLWMKFATALGLTREQVERAELLPETRDAIACLKEITRDGSYLEGISALYAYESQIPEVAAVKIEGLKKFYGISDDNGLMFFTVHQEADVHHSASELALLRNAVSESDQAACLLAAERSSQAMLKLLDGVYRVYVAPGMN